ncbi:50S ribosomal protein L15 [Candidatus Wolfebacteria bacterium CG02_land_8_20_14_3_00_37_12]|uniref:Large ribosomal subunit protein uL15 n=3 Tax=Candidatus Wolfeibacteriota TaxID=1752735 RepID=A0A2M7Q7G9_9BACT|nr:MAG: 50S ribosomal protein L15 [Candidatus Wolfebacteria bacterium CG02_land_8_20_14_3_00_37_12]PIY59348.1 MAG: 50S ribosomal protein L15 [Candidatus Wolfebacteria bacterium CG_4_10_14_0_8_um_filter_37_11]PJA41880.1 MAG: 50S ribosomal protein L15 [Candidatus Wolfebacteria bacterium CG_4_9_14_3_um_filter_37_9]
MQLHELKSQFKKKNKKRVGRGGKRGTTSGKGQKGQKSRSGHRIKPAEREMIQRLPKLRGLKNKSLQKKPIIIKIEDLNKKIEGGIINREVLIKAGLMKKSDKKIKILGNGEIKKSFQVEGLKISENAKKKIEAVGGKVV